MNTKKLIRNIRILIGFFTFCFLGIIVYITYFSAIKADRVVRDASNPRIRAEEEKVLRGSIMDRDGNVVAKSERGKDGKQNRLYYNGNVFAHVTGYSSYIYGKTGIELAYNDVLQGSSAEGDIIGVFFRGLRENINNEEKRGHDIYLTIDKNAQMAAYKALGSNKGAAVAIDPETGEILALVSRPSFNPQYIEEDFDKLRSNEEKPFVNRANQGYYPPGSVFKIITAASVIEKKPELLNEYFKCTGKLTFNDYVLSCHGFKAHGKLNLKGAFRVSCNYTFGSLGIKLGYENLEETAKRFMFNGNIKSQDRYEALNIKAGRIKIDNKDNPALLAQDAIGQHGISSNPMHMALVASAIANDGVMMKPYIVKEIRDRYGVTINKTAPERLSTAVESNTAETIKGYMVDVVKNGTGSNARIAGIQVGGKTGSAENTEGKEPHSWFVAFAPADNPKIAVAVIVENGGTGGGKAAEAARKIIKAYLKK